MCKSVAKIQFIQYIRLYLSFDSAKQNELQEDYYAVEAKRAELQRIMDAEGKIKLHLNLSAKSICFNISI